jgi:hypothetical protein
MHPRRTVRTKSSSRGALPGHEPWPRLQARDVVVGLATPRSTSTRRGTLVTGRARPKCRQVNVVGARAPVLWCGGTSAGVSFGDPANPARGEPVVPRRLRCAGFAHGIVIDGPGSSPRERTSPRTVSLIRRCDIHNNGAGLYVKTNFESRSHRSRDVTSTTTTTQPFSSANSARRRQAVRGDQPGVFRQHVQRQWGTDGWVRFIARPRPGVAQIQGSSFEEPGSGSLHIAALSDGSRGTASRASGSSWSTAICRATAPSSYRELIVLAAGELRIANCRLVGQIPSTGPFR